MKKLISIAIAIFITSICGLKAIAMDFETAYNQCSKKPVFALIYAEWASNYQGDIDNFEAVGEKYANDANFVLLDIAKEDMAFYNSKYHMYPNIPYVVMYTNGGTISRYIPRDCVEDYRCLEGKIKAMIK